MVQCLIAPSDRIHHELLKTLRQATGPERAFGFFRRPATNHWDELVETLATERALEVQGWISDPLDVTTLLAPELKKSGGWGSPGRAWIKDIARVCGSLSEHLGGTPVHLALGPAALSPRWTPGGGAAPLRMLCPYSGEGLEFLVESHGSMQKILHCPRGWVVAEQGARYRPCPTESLRGQLHLVVTGQAPPRPGLKPAYRLEAEPRAV